MWGDEDKPQDADAKYEKEAPVQASSASFGASAPERPCGALVRSHIHACRCQAEFCKVSCALSPPAPSPGKHHDHKKKQHICAQVDNKTDLEYQAGQDDREEAAGEDQQQKPADGTKPDEKPQPEGAAGEEEQQQDVPEQVLQSAILSSQAVTQHSTWLRAVQQRRKATDYAAPSPEACLS